MNKYTVDYFIKKFEAIPESMWITRSQGRYNGPSCAFGHCREGRDDFASGKEVDSLGDLFSNCKIYGYGDYDYPGVARVNNGDHPDYTQPTPKQRILAALYDIKKIQDGGKKVEYPDLTKSLAILPIEETTDLIIAKTLQP